MVHVLTFLLLLLLLLFLYRFWIIGTIRGVRIGFTGCLSTVSTFVSEVAGLKKKGRAYTYVVVSLASTCIVGCGIYGLVISLF